MVASAAPPKSEFTRAVDALQALAVKHGLDHIHVFICPDGIGISLTVENSLADIVAKASIPKDSLSAMLDVLGEAFNNGLEVIESGRQQVKELQSHAKRS
jgi:hypothetical protein